MSRAEVRITRIPGPPDFTVLRAAKIRVSPEGVRTQTWESPLPSLRIRSTTGRHSSRYLGWRKSLMGRPTTSRGSPYPRAAAPAGLTVRTRPSPSKSAMRSSLCSKRSR